ncbi:uncharacterized protein EI97DRAFT_456863 [Westerdykella ornata]|uniref:Aminoglycoside phosphotransferase domain-containing protein n=1 Tax=Westerdykella ornata TaxID=318751 RepID=A0A6A6JPC6_WESOR|nr:uncharacterized protein EI97DRAFT_456863 [Westerdykella ornata]KAF2278471.1 hypothetical protein EI97DRAFT_456863 [Westerdykella ornata]
MRIHMQYDDVAWERSDEIYETWRKKLNDYDLLREIGLLIAKHRGGVPEELCSPERGAFNLCIRMKFRDGGSAIIRFPCPGKVMFPEDTTIPIPFVLHYGMTDESPGGLGPFIIMEYVNHEYNLASVLKTPGLPGDVRATLDPEISDEKLELAYS